MVIAPVVLVVLVTVVSVGFIGTLGNVNGDAKEKVIRLWHTQE
jgi:hypothetical protein